MAIDGKRILTSLFFALICSLVFLSASSAHAQMMELNELAISDPETRQQRLVEGAKKEGALLFYTTTPVEYVDRLIAPFQKKYGIKVDVWRARSELILNRVLNEARAGKTVADVIASISPPMEALHRENLLQEVVSPHHAQLIPSAVPAHRQWVSTLQYVFAQAYNTSRIDKDQLPKTYQDLLNPRWKGMLGIEGSDHEWVTSVITDMGEAQGTQFFYDLVQGNGLSVRNGHPLLTNLVASGEVPLALTVYQYSAAQAKEKGSPIDWFVIEPAVTIGDAMAIPKGAPHPHAALLFYDYMISEEAQRILADIGYYTTNSKVDPPMKDVKLKVLDPAVLLDEQEESYERFESILRANR